jgi:hypothetical protein
MNPARISIASAAVQLCSLLHDPHAAAATINCKKKKQFKAAQSRPYSAQPDAAPISLSVAVSVAQPASHFHLAAPPLLQISPMAAAEKQERRENAEEK